MDNIFGSRRSRKVGVYRKFRSEKNCFEGFLLEN